MPVSEEEELELLRDYHYLETGHLKLSISDFGWWKCRACGKRGDDFDDPAEVECTGVAKQEKLW